MFLGQRTMQVINLNRVKSPYFHCFLNQLTQYIAMIKHSLHVIKRVIEHLNPMQTPVITFGQPLYALVKQIQWKWPGMYGEDKFVIMFGGFLYLNGSFKDSCELVKRKWVAASLGGS